MKENYHEKPGMDWEKKIEKTLIQGGMGIGVSLSGLAGAVAKEGGAGTISAAQIGFLQPEFEQNPVLANLKAMEEELQKARKIAPDGILGFNIMVAMNHYETYVRKAVETGADFMCPAPGCRWSFRQWFRIQTLQLHRSSPAPVRRH